MPDAVVTHTGYIVPALALSSVMVAADAVDAVDALPVSAPTKVVVVKVPVDGTNDNFVLLVLAD